MFRNKLLMELATITTLDIERKPVNACIRTYKLHYGIPCRSLYDIDSI